MIVIQEWWGITDTIKAHAEKIAEEGGFRVFVPVCTRASSEGTSRRPTT